MLLNDITMNIINETLVTITNNKLINLVVLLGLIKNNTNVAIEEKTSPIDR